ncbi:IQ domain-containing protein IQM2 [Diospyros lotus]|uniref:IQ domain-containing protein IQM2 n=1 Tax=Diospyros lotus TaxID=55363 RepID=UPI00224EBAE0|nr:IQ domain-containing protein IQM2 [Diospyros lotus]
MGISFSCPFAAFNDLENGFESVVLKSISFLDDEVQTRVRPISFKSRDSEPAILQSKTSGNTVTEESVNFKTTETEKIASDESLSTKEGAILTNSSAVQHREMDEQSPRSDDSTEKTAQLPILDPSNPKHEAAIKLQKVYKSFRTRRKLADCAVLVEQSWWKLLDFAELKRSSISFFDIEKHETAISRWSRARTRAAKVGKGLSKNGSAQKLALQHWLEAIDPRHRYGHNLQLYYVKWLQSPSKEPFFYWLDIGEGKEVNLIEKCPRSKLQQQCIKYLGPMERKAYEVVVEDGKLLCKQSGELLDTTKPQGAKWIFVLSTSRTLYVGRKKKGTFQHSSFLAGGATSAAGRIVVENGILKAVWPHSGHYRPTPENFQDFISFLKGNNVDLTDVKMDPMEDEIQDEEESLSKQSSVVLRSVSSEEDLTEKDCLKTEQRNAEHQRSSGETNSRDEMDAAATTASESPKPMPFVSLQRTLTNLFIPGKGDSSERFEFEDQAANVLGSKSLLEEYVPAEGSFASEPNQMVSNQDLSDEEDDEKKEEAIPKESILKRINSHKGQNSYQLGKHLSLKWTSGAGPRIGCVRDYPSELQFRALEKVKLSPRSACHFRPVSTRESIPKSFSGEICIKKTSFSGGR